VLRLFVHELGVFLEGPVVRRAHRVLELVNRLRVEQVILAVVAPLVLAAGLQRVAVDLPVGERALMPGQTSWAMTSRPTPRRATASK